MDKKRFRDKPYRIIRWSGPVRLHDGRTATMTCYTGTLDQVRAYADDLAAAAGVEVEAII